MNFVSIELKFKIKIFQEEKNSEERKKKKVESFEKMNFKLQLSFHLY